jgi:tRNA 2-thiouridine synthesizing protein E
MPLNAAGLTIPTTDDGFLCDARDWSEEVAQSLAHSAGMAVPLTPAHWEVIHFIRDYHARFRHLPNNRMFVKAVEKTLGLEKGNSRYLNALFSGSPVKHACLLAGLPKPPGCI